MNTAQQLMFVALLTGASAAMAAAESGKPEKVEAFYGDHIATVEDIDHESGTIAVKDDKGNTMIMQIYPETRGFDQIEQGDHGKIKYLESVAVSLSPADEPGSNMPEPTGESIIVRNPGVKPAGTPVETFSITGTIDHINNKTRVARLKGPNGNEYRISVDKNVPGFRKLDNGDQVTAELTPMLALDMDPR
ncbi:MAG TPA: hypothetical protein VFX02_03160 [Gammaproteobacteria bacterium]|nr:hypothetical protein [Gammaproteobacteria bacterium]